VVVTLPPALRPAPWSAGLVRLWGLPSGSAFSALA